LLKKLCSQRRKTRHDDEAAIVPAVNEKWEIKDVPNLEPGPNQVLIKVHASGMCYTDVHQTKGELPGEFPRTLGHEPVGEVVALGKGKVRFRAVIVN
jgi:D-arabinose 1-dehydrogenase-like Zn-dependent alcohol dehydrogenase